MRLSGRKVVLAGLLSAKVKAPGSITEPVRAELEAAGATIVAEVIQRRGVSRDSRPGGARRMSTPLSPTTVIGEGKAHELAQVCSTLGADLVVFLNPLTQHQRDALHSITGVAVQDVESLGVRPPALE
jgi:50S ribosomal subunit-associated GTPase HflX